MPCTFDVSIIISGIVFIFHFILGDKPPIRSVVFNHPQVGKILDYIGITVSTPLFVRTSNPVDTDFVNNVRRIVKGLSHVVKSAPHRYPQRAFILPTRTLHYPPGTFGGSKESPIRSRSLTPLLGYGAKFCGRHQPLNMFGQFGKVFLVEVDHAENFFPVSRTVRRRRDNSFKVKTISIHQQMSH